MHRHHGAVGAPGPAAVPLAHAEALLRRLRPGQQPGGPRALQPRGPGAAALCHREPRAAGTPARRLLRPPPGHAPGRRPTRPSLHERRVHRPHDRGHQEHLPLPGRPAGARTPRRGSQRLLETPAPLRRAVLRLGGRRRAGAAQPGHPAGRPGGSRHPDVGRGGGRGRSPRPGPRGRQRRVPAGAGAQTGVGAAGRGRAGRPRRAARPADDRPQGLCGAAAGAPGRRRGGGGGAEEGHRGRGAGGGGGRGGGGGGVAGGRAAADEAARVGQAAGEGHSPGGVWVPSLGCQSPCPCVPMSPSLLPGVPLPMSPSPHGLSPHG